MARDAISHTLRDALASGRAIRVVGHGGWLHAGHPVNASASVSTAADGGIVEYVPGDLTLTARAGTTLAELREATRANAQWLPLDPWGGDTGTIGATISTASAGPHAHAMGLPRDVVLGLEFVTGAGETVRSGGRVVKNVAGFDLTRLLIGAWGTLGVITEVTVRLRARPTALRTFVVPVRDDAGSLNHLAVSLRALPFTPVASEVVSGPLASRLGLPPVTTLLVRLGGNVQSVRAQADGMQAFGMLAEAPPGVWDALRSRAADAGAAWRLSDLPSRFGETWSAAMNGVRGLDAVVHGNPARGVVRVAAAGDADRLAAAATMAEHAVVECLPPDAWRLVPTRASGRLERAIRAKFDPRGILNPGILGT